MSETRDCKIRCLAIADVNEVLASGLVILSGADLSFSHDLVREAVYDLIAPDRRRRLHARFTDVTL